MCVFLMMGNSEQARCDGSSLRRERAQRQPHLDECSQREREGTQRPQTSLKTTGLTLNTVGLLRLRPGCVLISCQRRNEAGHLERCTLIKSNEGDGWASQEEQDETFSRKFGCSHILGLLGFGLEFFNSLTSCQCALGQGSVKIVWVWWIYNLTCKLYNGRTQNVKSPNPRHTDSQVARQTDQ